ncbi:MAG: hypothetical protein AAGG08_10805 [Actinomycetota bacterium]
MYALVTADVVDDLDPDLEPLAAAMRERIGHERLHIVSWDDPAVDWAAFDAALIRSTWDYTQRLAEFLGWIERVDAVTRLVNAATIVGWNADKRYLTHLGAVGVPITPTILVAPGEAVPTHAELSAALVESSDHRDVISGDAEVFVVKPSVGAGSNGARRCRADEIAPHVAHLHGGGRTAMIQPYLAGLDADGETALCFVPHADSGLRFSHAFRKAAILTSTDVPRIGDLFAEEDVGQRVPTDAELALGHQVLAALESVPQVRSALSDGLLFARVDVAPHLGRRDDPAALVLMELELIEPSFYLSTTPGSAGRLASAFLDRLGDGTGDDGGAGRTDAAGDPTGQGDGTGGATA